MGGKLFLGLSALFLGASISQATLTITNDLTAWFKADAIVGLSDGGLIGTWLDSSASSLNISQNITISMPTWQSNILNANPVVRFDGSTQSLIRSDVLGANFLASNAGTFYFVLRNDTLSSGQDFLQWGGGEGQVEFFSQDGGADKLVYFNHGILPRSTAVPGNWESSFHLIEFYRSGPTGNIQLDYTNLYNSSTAFSDLTNLNSNYTLNVGGAGFFDGDIAEILIYDIALSSTERDSVYTYLNDKYFAGGLAGPVPEPAEVLYALVLALMLAGYKRFHQRAEQRK